VKKRVVVLGCRGMLGHQVFAELLSSGHAVNGTVRGTRSTPNVIDNVDATNFERVEQVLREMRPHFVINCIGVVTQRPAPVTDYISVNALFPHRLAVAVDGLDARLIHVSTDCVFSGRKGSYTEADAPDAHDIYGMTKLLGEPASARTLTIRTSFVGRELQHQTGLFEWFLAQKTCRGFTEHYFSGVPTIHLARVIRSLIDADAMLSGVYHVSGPRMSKYELLCAIRDALQLDTEIVPDGSVRCDRSLVGDRFDAVVGRRPPSLRELVSELADDLRR